MKQIVLASASPRRRELLALLGYEYRCVSPDVDEGAEGEQEQDPRALVMALAAKKALWASGRYGDALCLGADTLVVCDDRVLGKPRDEAQAYEMLKTLQGRCHHVYTGVCVDCADTGQRRTSYGHTQVRMMPLEERQIRDYIATGQPMDKAGAYGIQGVGATFIHSIVGCYYNVMGLPLAQTKALLETFGV